MSGRSRGRRSRGTGARSRPAHAKRPPARAARPLARPSSRSDDEHLHPRDRGPVRAYVRDLVDGRWHLLNLFMPVFAVALIAYVNRPSGIRTLSLYLSVPLLAVMAVEAVVLGIGVTRKARLAYPQEQVAGLRTGWYAFMRVHRPRRMRLPAPRVPA